MDTPSGVVMLSVSAPVDVFSPSTPQIHVIQPTLTSDAHYATSFMGSASLNVWDQPIKLDVSLWRYMSVGQLQELIRDRTLYFPAATQFEDEFEGAVAVQNPALDSDPRYAEPGFGDDAFRELKRLTKISCWHIESFESDAMWQLYSGDKKGVAIRSTPRRILESVEPYRIKPRYEVETLHLGPIRYKDLTQVKLDPSMLKRFFYKHRAFAWEREYRLAISLRMAEEYGVEVPEEGIRVAFALNSLISKIVFGPSVDEEITDEFNDNATKRAWKSTVRYHL